MTTGICSLHDPEPSSNLKTVCVCTVHRENSALILYSHFYPNYQWANLKLRESKMGDLYIINSYCKPNTLLHFCELYTGQNLEQVNLSGGKNPHSGKINPACMQHHYICNIHLQVNVSLHQQDTNPRNKMTRLTSSVEISPGFLSPQADFPGDGPQQFDDVCQVIVIATEVFSRIGLK